jgi:hypothetical protein
MTKSQFEFFSGVSYAEVQQKIADFFRKYTRLKIVSVSHVLAPGLVSVAIAVVEE